MGCITRGHARRADVILSARRTRSNALLRISVRSIYHVETRTRSLADKRLGCSRSESVGTRSASRIAQTACFGIRNRTGARRKTEIPCSYWLVVLIWTCAASQTVELGRIGSALDEVGTA